MLWSPNTLEMVCMHELEWFLTESGVVLLMQLAQNTPFHEPNMTRDALRAVMRALTTS